VGLVRHHQHPDLVVVQDRLVPLRKERNPRNPTVGYAPSASNGGLLRRIRVRVSAPGRAGLSARTRISYRYEQTAENQ
jgi:hypothetical protein